MVRPKVGQLGTQFDPLSLLRMILNLRYRDPVDP